MGDERGQQEKAEASAGRSGEVADDRDPLLAELALVRRQLQEAQHEWALAAERERFLRAELQHRVRNMLAVIRSIFSRTVDSGHSPVDIADHFRGRLDALARFQAARGVNPLSPSYLEDIVRDELLSFEFDDRIHIEGEEVAVPNDVAQSLSLAIHELATNSVKFGALSTADKRMRLNIHWHRAGSNLIVAWVESGVPVLTAVPVRQGFGREFIEHALPYQLAATTVFDLKPGGLSCTIKLPLEPQPSGNTRIRNWI